MPWPALLALGVMTAAFLRSRRSSARTPPPPLLTFPLPVEAFDVLFARGISRPLWPIADSTNARKWEVPYYDVNKQPHGNVLRRFGAPRSGEKGPRHHAGIDLYANAGDTVRAMESGTIVATQTFLGGTHAILQATDTGLTILYGEVAPNSWKDFNVMPGSRVVRGSPIAKVGLIQKPGGGSSHMLHLETYAQGVTKNMQWFDGESPPAELRNPTLYALQAKSATMPVV